MKPKTIRQIAQFAVLTLAFLAIGLAGIGPSAQAQAGLIPGLGSDEPVSALVDAPTGSALGYFPGMYQDFDLAGNTAFLTDTSGRLHIVDVSDPANPVETGSPPDIQVYLLALNPPYAYMGDGNVLYTVDISNPVSPTIVASLNLPTNAPGIISPSPIHIYTAGHYAYVTRVTFSPHFCDGDVVLVDISIPAAPFVAGQFGAGYVDDLFAQGDDLYLSHHSCYYGLVSSILSRYDISDPANPVRTTYQMVTKGTGGPYAAGIAVDGNDVYMGVTDYPDPVTYFPLFQPSGLRVYDISDPLTMTLKAFYPTPGQTPTQIELLDDTLYANQVGDENGLFGIQVFDGLGSANLVKDNFYPTVHASDFRVTHDNFFVLGDCGCIDLPGLYILPNPNETISGKVSDWRGNVYSDVSIAVSASLTTTTGTNGEFLFNHMPEGAYNVIPALEGYSFLPPSYALTLPPSNNDLNFTLMPAPVSTTLFPGISATLSYTDTGGMPTRLDIPPGAAAVTSTLTLTPTLVDRQPGFVFIGHAFDLALQASAGLAPQMNFSAPLTVTIQYGNFDVRQVSDENLLALWQWDGSAWVDATERCDMPGAYNRNPGANRLSLPVCSTGRFALFGPTHNTFLPLVAQRPIL